MKLIFRVPLRILNLAFQDKALSEAAWDFLDAVLKNCHTFLWECSIDDFRMAWPTHRIARGSPQGHLISVLKDSLYARKSRFYPVIGALVVVPDDEPPPPANGDWLTLTQALQRAQTER